MNYLIKLVMGDGSSDGHGRTQVQYITSNMDVYKLEGSFDKGCKMLGISFHEYCDDSDTRYIPISDVKKILDKAGQEWWNSWAKNPIEYIFSQDINEKAKECDEDFEPDFEEIWVDGENISVWQDFYAFLWLTVAKIGNNKVKVEFANPVEHIRIGGYGLD